jgi:hypothetical protein
VGVGMGMGRGHPALTPPPLTPPSPPTPQVRLTKTAGCYVERALQLWLHENHPDVALHIDHRVQQLCGSQQLAAVGALIFYTGAEHLVGVPPPSAREA